jgi:uridine phosphorylase
MKRPSAWYLRIDDSQAGASAVLVGDRSRVWTIANGLDDYEVLNEDRGLLTVTGSLQGQQITVVAFGMGAPIAAIVVHELANLGVKRFLRLGTMLSLGDTRLGDFILATEAVVAEGTSAYYEPGMATVLPNRDLSAKVRQVALARHLPLREGIVRSSDGFYTDMMVREPKDPFSVQAKVHRQAAAGIIGSDMETSAIFAAGNALGVATASLCLATVDALTAQRLEDDKRLASEAELAAAGLEALVMMEQSSTEESK